MTFVTRFDPFREFVTLQDRMNRLARQSNEQEMMRRAARSSFR